MQEEKSYSLPLKDFSYNQRMAALDSVRQFIVDHQAKTNGASLSGWSKKLGKNHAYLFQFIHKGSPAELPEKVRKHLAIIMGAPEEKLRHPDRRTVALGQEFEPDPDADVVMTEDHRPFADALPQMVGRMGGGSTGAVITIDVGDMQSREPVGDWWRIPPSVLRGLARADSARTVGFAMDGDSMEPTIQRTDIVFVDTGRQKIEPDGIWALDYGLGRTMKRVAVRKTEGGIRYVLKSDNKSYPDEEYAPEEVTIFGRYIGRFSVF